jgi:hypothetical protein
MAVWTKNKALAQIDALVTEVDNLKNAERFSAEHTRWTVNTLRFLREVFGEKSTYFITIRNFRWQQTGDFVIQDWNVAGAIEQKHQEAYVNQLDSAKGILLAARDQLESSDINSVYAGKDTGAETSEIVRVINLAEKKLRKAIQKDPENEKEIQNAFENLLLGADIPYSREAKNIEYSSKTYFRILLWIRSISRLM